MKGIWTVGLIVVSDEQTTSRSPTRTHLARTLFALLVVGLSAWVVVSGVPSEASIRSATRHTGALGPVAFVGIYVGWTLLILPGAVPALASGALFGVGVGCVLSVIAATIGATVAFGVARRLRGEEVRRVTGRHGKRIERWLARRGFLLLLYARLIPVVPFNVLNYAAGLSSMSVRRYVAATAIGILPGTVAYVVVGSSAQHPGSAPFLVSVGAIVVLTAVVTVVGRRGGLADREDGVENDAE